MNWDHGQKVFASSTRPDIIGFAGNASFIPQVLSKVMALLDIGLLFNIEDGFEQRSNAVFDLVEALIAAAPQHHFGNDTILYLSRDGTRDFSLASINFPGNGRKPTRKTYPLPQRSDLICTYGSGGESVRRERDRWFDTKVSGTSRAVFGAFGDAVKGGKDPGSGGPPQLAGLYRKGPAVLQGVVWNQKLYILSVELTSGGPSTVEWRNEMFERCDPRTGELIKGAQKQSRPESLRQSRIV